MVRVLRDQSSSRSGTAMPQQEICRLTLFHMNAYIFGNTGCRCARVKAQERIYSLNKGVESLSKEEHGLFFDAMQRLGLPNEVKQAAVALYLDFKSRPIGEYNDYHKNQEIFTLDAA